MSESPSLMDTLRNRLEEQKRQRTQLEAQGQQLSRKVSSMIKQAPKRPRDSVAELKQRIKDLERTRTTTSMSLTAEKNILKEIKNINGEIKLHSKSARYQASIDVEKQQQVETRARIGVLRKQINELETGLKKLAIADKIYKNSGTNVSVAQLVRTEVQVRREDTPHLKRDELEARHPVVVELDARSWKVRIYGAQADVDACAAFVTSIASATIEKTELTDKEAKIVSKNMVPLQTVCNMHNVSFTFNRRTLTLRGAEEAISAAMDGVKTLTGGERLLDLKANMVSIVIGRKGATIMEMEQTHNVVCKVSEKGTAPVLCISGPPGQVAKCAEEYTALMLENEIFEVEVPVSSSVIPYIFGKGGARIRQMQVDSKARIDVPRGQNVVIIKGKKACVASAKALVEAAAAQWALENVTMTISPDQMYALASNRSVLDGLRPEVPECKVNPMFRQNELKLRGGAEDVAAMKKFLEGWFAELEIVKLPMHKEVTGKIIGNKGKVIDKIQKESGAAVKVDDELVTISGSKEAVAAAKAQVDEILKVNQVVEVTLPVSFIGNFIGSGGSGIKKFQEENSVSVDLPRKRDRSAPSQTVFICGEAEPVKAAGDLLQELVVKFEKENKDMRLYPEVMGTVIGSKGSSIKKLEEASGCKLKCDSSSGLISIRGPEEAIPKAEALIIELVGEAAVWSADAAAPVKVPVPAGYIKHVVGKKYAVIHQMQKDHNVVIIVGRGKDVEHVTLLGKPAAIESAKAAIEQLLDEVVRVKESIDVHTKLLTNVFGEKLAGLNRLRASIGVRIDVRPHEENRKMSVVTVDGQRSSFELAMTALRAAKAGNAMRSVRVVRSHLASLHNSDRNLTKIADDECCKITVDDASSSIIIVGKMADASEGQKKVRLMLGFIYEGAYACRVLPASYMPILLAKRAEILTQFERTHAKVNPKFERESRSLSLCGEAEPMAAAQAALDALLLEHSKENAEIAIPDASFIPIICGPRWVIMNKVKEDTGCSRIDIDREQLVVQIKGPSESVEQAKEAVMALLESAQKQQCSVPIDTAMVPQLIGKKGANIQAMEKEFECRINVSRGSRTVQLRGPEENIARARARIEEMREALAKQQCEIEIDPEMVPSLIGARGATIQALEKELGCRINVSRDSGILTVRGAAEDKIENARLRIEAFKRDFEERKATEQAEREARDQEEDMEREAKRAERAAAQPQNTEPMGNGHQNSEESNGPPQESQYSSVPIGGAASQYTGAALSKNALRRQRRRHRKDGTNLSAMEMLMGSATAESEEVTSSKAAAPTSRRSSRNSQPELSEAMQLLGLASSAPPGFEAEKEEDSADRFYASTSGYTLRL